LLPYIFTPRFQKVVSDEVPVVHAFLAFEKYVMIPAKCGVRRYFLIGNFN